MYPGLDYKPIKGQSTWPIMGLSTMLNQVTSNAAKKAPGQFPGSRQCSTFRASVRALGMYPAMKCQIKVQYPDQMSFRLSRT